MINTYFLFTILETSERKDSKIMLYHIRDSKSVEICSFSVQLSIVIPECQQIHLNLKLMFY